MPDVASNSDSLGERFLAILPGWMFLLSGLALLAMAILTPEWLAYRHLDWQRDLMREQAERFEAQAQHYADFHEALAADDPVLLERLAFTQLRLTPVGKQPLQAPTTDPVASGRTVFTQHRPGGAPQPEPPPLLASESAAVDAWLTEPLPQVGVDVAPPRPINSRLTRLATGPHRTALIAAGLACLAAGVWSGPRRDRAA